MKVFKRTLYIAMNNKWHVAIRNKSSCAGIKLRNLKEYAFNNKNEILKDIPLYLENICSKCYRKNTKYVNKKIIEHKLGIKQ